MLHPTHCPGNDMIMKLSALYVDLSKTTQNAGPKLGESKMRQLNFDWSSTDKYAELRNFKIEVRNMFQKL